MGKTNCVACNKKCKGQAIKLSESNFIHQKCFTCKECKKELPIDKFYAHNGSRYCAQDYQRLFGTKCQSCDKYVEGEVVTVLGKAFHRQCIVCAKCRKNIGAGNKLTVVKEAFWCQSCVAEAESAKRASESAKPLDESTPKRPEMMSLEHGQLTSPVSDFAADSTDGKEIAMPSPDLRSPNSTTSGYKSDVSVDLDSSGVEKSPEDTIDRSHVVTNNFSPDSNYETELRRSPQDVPNGKVNYGAFYRTSFLDKGPGFKRGPSINPQEKPLQHFHRPRSFSYRNVRTDIITKNKKTGMMNNLGRNQTATSSFRGTGEGPYKPVKTQEPIQLAKIPDAQRFAYDHKKPIERDDFVARPETAAVCPELLRDPSLREKPLRNGDVVDADNNKENVIIDPKIRREIEELSKISASGAARAMLEELKKKKSAEPRELDPISSSRAPSAAIEPLRRTRYDSPKFASPSRDVLRKRFWQFDDGNNNGYRRCVTPSAPRPGYGLRSKTLDHRNGAMSEMSFRGNDFDPGPGRNSSFGFRSATLGFRNGYTSDTTDGYYPSNYAAYHRRPESSNAAGTAERLYTPMSDTEDYDSTTGLKVTRNMLQRLNILVDGRLTPVSFRRKVPVIFTDQETTKVFPYETLRLDNQDRPPGLDSNALEQYLADDEFERLFRMPRLEFMSLPEWKRNDLKLRVGLFESASERPQVFSPGLEKPPTQILHKASEAPSAAVYSN